LTAAWGAAALPPVVVPKAVVGEFGGGLLAAAIVAAGGARFGSPAAFRTKDPQLDVTPHDGHDLKAPRRVLVTALAAGGSAAWTLLETP